jgi:hypothetical protein
LIVRSDNCNKSGLISRFTIFAVLICTLISACGSGRNIELEKQGVDEFHSQLNSEQYALLYARADLKFRGATTESDFAELLQAVHRKLGTVQNSNLRNTGVAWFAGQGATVTLLL